MQQIPHFIQFKDEGLKMGTTDTVSIMLILFAVAFAVDMFVAQV